ncbi:MAG TPA: hypothetical protein VLZ06_02110 [Solirubrobacteraceae bacterium]|nr:hypothetical protein [Solirubrobacteraceae bacterium]
MAAALTCLCCCACGGGGRPATGLPAPAGGSVPAPGFGGPGPLGRPAIGLSEDNAQLLLDPATAPGQRWASSAPAFQRGRRELAALQPEYIRLLVDWAALQPRADDPPELGLAVSGCARTVGPCGPYPGLSGELAAIASQQRARRAAGRAGPEVLIDILGAPAWASAQPSGCELAGAASSARALAPSAIPAYRQLVAALLSLARSEGVHVRWWSPWNEPNDALFINPQRMSCDPASSPVAPSLYAQLARAMAGVLHASAPTASIVLGELDGFTSDSAHATSVGSFVASLPADVVCLASAWSVHAYASYGSDARATDPVAALERALSRRGGCAGASPLWITETGAGAPRPGDPTDGSTARQLEACRALAGRLAGWFADPRVGAVFQYTFRDDPAFPVGLASADLRTLHPTYTLWLSLGRVRVGATSRAPSPEVCR